ncbi:hypothetical protein [Microbacterium sp. CFBP9034]|uniref:hypothetical protein n=1 Tax=Microbacterium sp. CFBP9034 TaxID=3096540 RepID=UPI002A69E0FA|nr:hypothetical protein [Microbacterium sp. CFBP9034]MDY0910380.1 hypothetical protein [Microbacterium sp. CFBP9034]
MSTTTTRSDRRRGENAPTTDTAFATAPPRRRAPYGARRPAPMERLNRRGTVVLGVGIAALVAGVSLSVLAPPSIPDAVLEAPTETVAGVGVPAGAATLTATLDGQQVVQILPSGTPVGVAVFFHGQGGDAGSAAETAWIAPLVSAGWVVATGDLHGDSWGSPTASSDVIDIVSWLTGETGLAPRLLVSEGMGALVSLNSLTRGAVEAGCWYGVEAMTDLTVASDYAAATELIADAYRGRPGAADNPVESTEVLGATGSAFRFVGADGEDTFTARNSGALAEALTAAGASVSMGEVGVDELGADLVEFAGGCAT